MTDSRHSYRLAVMYVCGGGGGVFLSNTELCNISLDFVWSRQVFGLISCLKIYVCVDALSAYMYVCHMPVWSPWRAKECIGFPGTVGIVVVEVCKLPRRYQN